MYKNGEAIFIIYSLYHTYQLQMNQLLLKYSQLGHIKNNVFSVTVSTITSLLFSSIHEQ